jgi:hypothetical protein
MNFAVAATYEAPPMPERALSMKARVDRSRRFWIAVALFSAIAFLPVG